MESDTRYDRWIKVSFSMLRFEPNMMPVIQGLGRLDVKLIEEDKSFLQDLDNNLESVEQNLVLSERLTISYLWVLGAYEAIRTMCQRIKDHKVAVLDEVATSLNQLKREFNRLRVPLAKMEPASSHKTDNHIAFPGINRDHGVAWQLNESTFVTRQQLSDSFLAALEHARAVKLSDSQDGDGGSLDT